MPGYLDRSRLDGRVALVTGAGQRIGLAACEALAEAGARVILTDRDGSLAETAAAGLRSKGLDVAHDRLEVTDPAEVVADRHPDAGILVNNAGIARSNIPAEAMSDEDWLRVVDVNLNGLFWCCRAFGAWMLGRRTGAIVNLAPCRARSSTGRRSTRSTTPPRPLGTT